MCRDGLAGVRCEIAVASSSDRDAFAVALTQDVRRAMRLQPGRVVADYVSGKALLSGSFDSERDARAIEDLLR